MRKKRGRKNAMSVVKLSVLIILVLWSITQITPLVWLYLSSMKTGLHFIRYPLRPMWPPHFENYKKSWTGITDKGLETGVKLSLYFINSIIVVFPSLLIIIVVSLFAGYAIARYKFRGRDAFFLILVGLVILPMHALIIPLYKMMSALHLVNNYIGLILVYVPMALSFSIIVMRSYFRSFPAELEDAARMDGCSEFGLFWRIVVPLSKGPIMVISIVNFVSLWNELLLSLVLLWQNRVRTLNVGLLSYVGQWGQIEWPAMLAGLSIAVTPTIVFYLIFHRHIIKGIMLGSLKA